MSSRIREDFKTITWEERPVECWAAKLSSGIPFSCSASVSFLMVTTPLASFGEVTLLTYMGWVGRDCGSGVAMGRSSYSWPRDYSDGGVTQIKPMRDILSLWVVLFFCSVASGEKQSQMGTQSKP